MSEPVDVMALGLRVASALREDWCRHALPEGGEGTCIECEPEVIAGVVEPIIRRIEQERDDANRRHAQHMHFCLTSKYDAKIVDQAEAALEDMADPPAAVSDLVQIARDALREVGALRSQLAAAEPAPKPSEREEEEPEPEEESHLRACRMCNGAGCNWCAETGRDR